MANTKISEFSSTPGNNTDIDGINIAEGCAPSGINNAIRELMSQLKDFQAGTAGDSFNGPVPSANLTGQVAVANGGTGSSTAAAAKVALQVVTGSTGSAIIPAGTQAQRNGTPTAGNFRFNIDVAKFEGYNGTSWGSVGGGATGGGSDAVFIENDQTVNSSYTITSGKNAGTFGPVTIASGVTVTVPSGSVWAIV
jgi:hypothetical protein